MKKAFSTICGSIYKLLSVLVFVMTFLTSVQAHSETRSLKLFYIHTNEKAEIVFKRDGRYDQAGLKKLNVFLRDWRRNEPTNMDPRLFDLIWSVYHASGSRAYINVVSAYRSPTTNNMLRSRSASSGVAKHSQHTLGHAMDFYLPDVNLAKLRAIGLKQQVGGVGYYPTSGSPFVHMDVGSVRHWPRMNRRELANLFPDGKTMHIPSDGKPFAGYAQAKAEWEARRGAPIMVASAGSEKKGFLSSLFGKKDNDTAPNVAVKVQPTAPQKIAPQDNKTTDNDVQQLLVSLPENDAPIPVTSPLYANALKPEEQTKADESEAKTPEVLAYANVPVPAFKPQSVSVEVNEEKANDAALSVPVPDQRPVITPPEDQVALAIANQPNIVAEDNKLNVPHDDLGALIEANDIIAVPDDDEDESDYADIDAEDYSNETVASINETKTAPKVDLPSSDDLAKVIAEDNKVTQIELAPEVELRQVPDLVFVSGLEKTKQQLPRYAQLSGKAITFHPIAKINETY